MNINLGKYVITSDEFQFILHERKVYGAKSKHVGMEFLSVVGYYPSWCGLAEKLVHLQINTDDADSVEYLVDNLNAAVVELTAKLENLNESTTTG